MSRVERVDPNEMLPYLSRLRLTSNVAPIGAPDGDDGMKRAADDVDQLSSERGLPPKKRKSARAEVRASSLFLDIPAIDYEYDQETLWHIQAPVQSHAELKAMLRDTPHGRATLLRAIDPRQGAKLDILSTESPAVTFEYTDILYDESTYEDRPMSRRPLFIIVQGQEYYDGPPPQMATFSAPTRSIKNIKRTIEQLMDWLREDDAFGWIQDTLGGYGPVDEWVGRRVDKAALSISSEIYAYMTDAQKQELMQFGYDGVHVQAAINSAVRIYVNPHHNGSTDEDEKIKWKKRLERRNDYEDGEEDFVDPPFIFKDKYYKESLPRLVQPTFRRIV